MPTLARCKERQSANSELLESRKEAEQKIARVKHAVLKVLQHNAVSTQMMLFGKIEGKWKEKEPGEFEFVALVEIEARTGTEEPKLKFFQSWVRR